MGGNSAFRGFFNSTGNDWEPHPALQPPKNQVVNLFLIGSHNVLHLSPRNHDPIFPTNSKRILHSPGQLLTTYTDNSSMLHPLACLESTLICAPDGNHCQPLGADWGSEFTPKTIQGKLAVYLTVVALSTSGLSGSIRGRLGSGLIAATKLSQAISLPLAPWQWEVECRRLFQTSLASAQIVIRDVARARWRDETGLVNVFDQFEPVTRKGLCGMYIFHSTGWKNFTVVGMVVTSVLVLVIQLVAFEVEGEITPVRWIWKGCVEAFHLLCKAAVEIGKVVKDWSGRLMDRIRRLIH